MQQHAATPSKTPRHAAAPCRKLVVCSTFGIPPVVLLALASSSARPAAALRDQGVEGLLRIERVLPEHVLGDLAIGVSAVHAEVIVANVLPLAARLHPART